MDLDVIRYTPNGDARKSPLLFDHGASHGAWCWKYWGPWFAQRGREVQALSLRGHAASPGKESLYSYGLQDYCADVLGVASSMDSPILIGHSMGGAVAQLAASQSPIRFKGLVLLASPPPDGLRFREMLPLILNIRGMLCLRKLAQGGRLSVREVQESPFIDGRVSAEEAAWLSERLQAESSKAAKEAGMFRAPKVEARLPVLVLGSTRDRLLPPSALRRTSSHYSGDLIILDSPCHDLMLDMAWEEAAEKLDGWLTARTL